MDLMAIRRTMMKINQSIIPIEYQPIEYIESNKNQWIVTNINCPSELVVYQKFAITNNSDQYGWGNRGTGYNICGFRQYNYKFQCYYGNTYHTNWNDNFTLTIGQQYNTKQVYRNGYQTYYVDNIQYGNWAQPQIGNTIGDKIWLFGANNSNLKAEMRLYYIKFMNGSETAKLGEFIPCIRKIDDKPGLYDTVSKTFYTNAGTIDFIIPT